VALNLSRDRLRRRRRRGYTGPWLPSPAPVEDLVDAAPSAEGRVGQAESLSYAFLVALEALTPAQRGVLLMRDVFDCSVAETAALLEMSPANVKVTLHRARKALAAAQRPRVGPEEVARVSAALGALVACMAAGDLQGARAHFAEDAVLLSDGGGQYMAAGVPVAGAERLLRVIQALAAKASPDVELRVHTLNGLPALIGRHTPGPRQSPTWVQLLELDGEGRVRRVYTVMADRKLTAALPPGW
jgi:hypothetical protein